MRTYALAFIVVLLSISAYIFLEISSPFRVSYQASVTQAVNSLAEVFTPAVLNKEDYDKRMNLLANNPPVASSTLSSTSTSSSTSTVRHYPWPVKSAYPNGGALLPFNRIIAYYGNFYSKNMGVLGQYPEQEVLQRLSTEVEKWKAADPTTSVIPAIHYIAVTAQGMPGADGMYRLRMPKEQIEKAIQLGEKAKGITILDVQVGLSDVQKEIPLFEAYLKRPDVHLAIDPEFSMKSGNKPGTVIGTMDASDINYVASYLAKIVKDNHLPPKILIVHRFTDKMLTNYKNIKTLPEVQIVMDMDGWGGTENKIATYRNTVAEEPVQFTGFKLFYKNDLITPSTRMLSPKEILNLRPKPIYIQYQ